MMMTFQLDTMGAVAPVKDSTDPSPGAWTWDMLSPFTQGYVEALLRNIDLVGEWLDNLDPYRAPAFSDLAPETLAQVIADCEAVQSSGLNASYIAGDGRKFYVERQDGAWGYFPPLTVQLGDDGKVRFTP